MGGSGGSGGSGGTGGAGGAGGSGGTSRMCPSGEFVTGLMADGSVVCSSLAVAARNYVNGRCGLYLGWRDSCSGCATEPSKWGRVGASTCDTGVGVDNVCIAPPAGGDAVQLLGVNFDGDVSDDDKFYVGLGCVPAPEFPAGGCPAGQFASGFGGDDQPICADATPNARAAINEGCFLYAGWRDKCDGCTTSPPAKWDRVSGQSCESLAGATGDTCTKPTLGGNAVDLLGIDLDGDVDGNDTLYAGIRCDDAALPPTNAAQSCPAEQAAIGLDKGGTLLCAPVASGLEAYFRSSCHVYLGWQDNCGGCSAPPTKWGRVSVDACENGVGVDDTCASYTLGGQTVQMFGLNPDGDVDDNDMLHFGFKCE
jgi:hypothetical protein